jgi:hypothetical protein
VIQNLGGGPVGVGDQGVDYVTLSYWLTRLIAKRNYLIGLDFCKRSHSPPLHKLSALNSICSFLKTTSRFRLTNFIV